MLIQPSLESLQEKYAKYLKGEVIQDFTPVTYKFNFCKLLVTESRLICIQDDINAVKSRFTLQKQLIEQIIYTTNSINIKYPRSAPLKVKFVGLNQKKNQIFAKSLPKSKPFSFTSTELLVLLGGGFTLFSLSIIGTVLNPPHYSESSTPSPSIGPTSSPEKFLSDCYQRLQAVSPNAEIIHFPPALSPGNRGVLTFEIIPKGSTRRDVFSCYQDSDGNLI